MGTKGRGRRQGSRRWRYLGVDPAPKKASTICVDGDRFVEVPATGMRAWIEAELAANPDVLIAWDAPLRFDPSKGCYDRPFDARVRRWLKRHQDRIAPGAVHAMEFARCPHWAITCEALGYPYGDPPGGLRLANTRQDLEAGGHWAIEVHPAVSLAVQWIQSGQEGPMPRYKPGRGVLTEEARRNLHQIVRAFPFPRGAGGSDDRLDACVAFEMAQMFLEGWAEYPEDPEEGGYVLPVGEVARELADGEE